MIGVKTEKTKALVITGILVILGFSFAIFFTDHPISSQKKNDSNIAAIAIRDDVIPFQKYGTRLFSLPYMNDYYSEVAYFTESYNGEHYQQFIPKLIKLLVNHDSVDIYLLAHTNDYHSWISEIDSTQRKKIRLVYNTGCSGASQGMIWKDLGVKYYVSHESSQSISPVFYFYFLRRYTNDHSLPEAIKYANEAMHEKLARLNAFSFGALNIPEELEYGSEGKLVVSN